MAKLALGMRKTSSRSYAYFPVNIICLLFFLMGMCLDRGVGWCLRRVRVRLGAARLV